MNKKIVLFVCKHNRFRSKVAEAFFNKFNKNENYIAVSAGLLPGKYPLDQKQIKVAKEFGIRLIGKPKSITTDLLTKINLIVIVADNVPSEIFNNQKYGRQEIVWNINDDYGGTPENIRKIIEKIQNNVKNLVGSLK